MNDSSYQSTLTYKSNSRVDTNQQQHDAEGDARVSCQTLRALSDRDAPVDKKQPDAVGEMPDSGCDTDQVDQENPPDMKLTGDDVESEVGSVRDRSTVESGNHAEPEVEHVKKDEKEENNAGKSLNQVEPVARVGISEVVGPRFHCDYKTVDGVIDERYKDAADLDEENVRNRLKIVDRFVEIGRAAQRF
jgi:hypothetical protein